MCEKFNDNVSVTIGARGAPGFVQGMEGEVLSWRQGSCFHWEFGCSWGCWPWRPWFSRAVKALGVDARAMDTWAIRIERPVSSLAFRERGTRNQLWKVHHEPACAGLTWDYSSTPPIVNPAGPYCSPYESILESGKTPGAVLGMEDFVGQTEVESAWPEGYGRMTATDARSLRK